MFREKMHDSYLHNILNKWSFIRRYLAVDNFTLCSSLKQHWSLVQRWANHSRNRPRRLRRSPRACPRPAWQKRRPSGSWGSPSRGHWSRSMRPPPCRNDNGVHETLLAKVLKPSRHFLSKKIAKIEEITAKFRYLPFGSSASVSTASGRTLAGSPGQHRHCEKWLQ